MPHYPTPWLARITHERLKSVPRSGCHRDQYAPLSARYSFGDAHVLFRAHSPKWSIDPPRSRAIRADKFAELEENRYIFIGADKMNIARETRKRAAADRGIDRFSVR